MAVPNNIQEIFRWKETGMERDLVETTVLCGKRT